jgi:hypothetical protein
MFHEFQGYFSITKDAITGLAAITATVIAIIGLRSWKKQLKGRTEYDLARRLLKAVYRVRDEIEALRMPLIYVGEVRQGLNDIGINAERNEKHYGGRAESLVYQSRWRRLHVALSDLQVELLEAEVSWGDEIMKRQDLLRECVASLFLNVYRRLWQIDDSRMYEVDSETQKEIDRILYKSISNPEADPFGDEIKRSIEHIEEYVKPYLKL